MQKLVNLIDDILCGSEYFLGGVQKSSPAPTVLIEAIVSWSQALKRDFSEVVAVIEPCLRQSILMSLIPQKAVDLRYNGSVDTAIHEHLAELGIGLESHHVDVLRNICLNMRKLKGMTAGEAREKTASLRELRADRSNYRRILDRQNGRCVWCGVHLDDAFVKQSLEHVTPKHIGDDHYDGSNWAIACKTCNEGKGDILAWATMPEAHDYVRRNDSDLGRVQRWAILMRRSQCGFCGSGPKAVELFIYKRVRTGLCVPANCSVVCELCVPRKQGLELLKSPWVQDEAGRKDGNDLRDNST